MTFDQIQTLIDNATPAPWQNIGGYRVASLAEKRLLIGKLDDGEVFNPTSENHQNDGDFIAAARSLLPILLELVKNPQHEDANTIIGCGRCAAIKSLKEFQLDFIE